MSQYFSPYVVSKNNIKVVLNLSGYAREDDLDYFKGKNLIGKNYLVFVPMNKYLNTETLKVLYHGNLWEYLMMCLSL